MHAGECRLVDGDCSDVVSVTSVALAAAASGRKLLAVLSLYHCRLYTAAGTPSSQTCIIHGTSLVGDQLRR